jgi:hypothetical protein
MSQSFLAVGRKLRDMTHLAERLDQVIGRIAIVFDDQEAHRTLAVIAGCPRRGIAVR